ncbi:uncharacterized protein LOC130739214 isoform X1 [Lotus japonicus]|uniref:uncharacterized protein LOC130739214 isoform X1 n=2 Tax=Lotus japonicus TaxID=34305 RepID=UPI00258B7CDC|nr:uncharacterized protein LOC130739214 isoform X1 [Lotus japonicus]
MIRFKGQQEEENHIHMDEKKNNNSSRVSRSKAAKKANEGSCGRGEQGVGPTTTTSTRFATVDDGGEDLIECSGKFCRSCTAGMVADCVALCCCPCAVVHCFSLAFVKAPWVVGRRCLGLGKKNKNKNKGKRKCKKGHHHGGNVGDDVVLERDSREGVSTSSVSSSFGVENVTVNAAFEAEKVWLELYQIGHLDFGRVSFSGD